ncbi:MAG: hypothetical protein ACEQSB_02430 [Undibacterium sp.]
MSGAQQYRDPVQCVLFGEHVLLPQDTTVQVSVEAYGARPENRSGSKDFLAYTVGMRFALSHANLAAGSRTFSERSHRLKIEVRTKYPYDPGRSRQLFEEEVSYIDPILRDMEDLALKNYYEGTVSFDTFRDYFTSEYRRRQGTRSRRRSRRQ